MKEELVFKEIVAPYDMNVQSENGVHGARLEAGVPKMVHPEIFYPALRLGCTIPGGVPGQDKLDEQIVERLVSTMRLIRQVGHPEQMTSTGEPRVAELKKIVPTFTPEQRMEAWELVLAEEAGVDPDLDNEEENLETESDEEGPEMGETTLDD